MKEMKHFPVFVFIFFLGIGLLFPRAGIREYIEMFALQGNNSIRFSLETYKERDGEVPLVLSFDGLEVSHPGNASLRSAAAGGDYSWTGDMLGGDRNLYFTIYEQNPVRTRLRLKNKNTPALLTVNRQKKEAAFYIGDSPLKLNPLRAAFQELPLAGLYELIITGSNVHTYKRFIYKPAAGVFYAVPFHLATVSLDLENCPVWAIKTGEQKIKKERE